jgi:hypothetical protein
VISRMFAILSAIFNCFAGSGGPSTKQIGQSSFRPIVVAADLQRCPGSAACVEVAAIFRVG